MKKCSLIYNPVSSGFSNKTLDEVSSVIYNKGYDLNLLESKKAGHVVELVKEANDGYLTISMGGDGTVGEALKGYKEIEQQSYYSHISTGTTNDVAANFGLLKNEPVESAKLILNGNPHKIDTLSVNGESFAYVSCFGFLTNVPYDTKLSLKRRFGKFGYIIRAFSHDLLAKRPNYKIRYTIDGVKNDATCILGAVSNSKAFGGVNIYKDAKIDDGVFEVLFLKDINLKVMLSMIKDYFVKNSIDLSQYSDFLVSVKTDNIEIEFLDLLPVHPIDNDGDRAEFEINENNRYLNYHYDGKVKMLLPNKNL